MNMNTNKRNDIVFDALILTEILIRNVFEWDELNYLQYECWNELLFLFLSGSDIHLVMGSF